MPVSRFTAASYETGLIFRVIHSMTFNIILYDTGIAENCRKARGCLKRAGIEDMPLRHKDTKS